MRRSKKCDRKGGKDSRDGWDTGRSLKIWGRRNRRMIMKLLQENLERRRLIRSMEGERNRPNSKERGRRE